MNRVVVSVSICLRLKRGYGTADMVFAGRKKG